MTVELAERALAQIAQSPQWPPEPELKILEDIHRWQWIREADGVRLKGSHPGGWDEDKTYLVDPLGSRIAEAFADLQFGEEPDFISGKKSDQSRLETLVQEANLSSEFQYAAEVQVSEGEVWWRGRISKDYSEYPIIEFHSRSHVIPYFRGQNIPAVIFVQVIEEGDQAWRYTEVHTKDWVVNKLFEVPAGQVTDGRYVSSLLPQYYQAGRPFGNEVSLTSRPETENLRSAWNHGCGMLAGRVLNRRGRTYRAGISQYARVQDLLYSLNEAATIGQQNMRLTARKRVVVDESILQPTVDYSTGQVINPAPVLNSQEEVFVASGLDENLEAKQGQFKVLEYDFDAAAMIAWYEHLTEVILTRTRTAPALVGRHTTGATTAPALRARMLDSQLAANSKAGFWDSEAPKIISSLQRLDALPTSKGGFGRPWSSPTERPAMIRKSIIPEDPKDKTDRHATAMGAELESQYTAIADMHPEWDDKQINEEISRIKEDNESQIGDRFENGKINRNPGEVDPLTGNEPRRYDGNAPKLGETS